MHNVTPFLFLVVLLLLEVPIIFIFFLGFGLFFNSPILDYFDQNTGDTSYYYKAESKS